MRSYDPARSGSRNDPVAVDDAPDGAVATDGGGYDGTGTVGDAGSVDGDSDEFDPVGTMALILVYFGILVVAWVFVYFVEFLGRDLVVIG